MSFFRNKESYLGVDLGAGGIKIVELKKTKGRAQLWTYGIAEKNLNIYISEKIDKSPEDLVDELGSRKLKKPKKDIPTIEDPRVEEYANILKSLLKEAKVTTKQTTASLPVSYIFHTVLNLPKVEDKEINHIVRAQVKKMLPIPIEEMQLVHQKIPQEKDTKDKTIKILVTAAPKSLVAFYTAIFQKAGLELKELETEAFALQRSLVGKDKGTCMVIDIGAERTSFFIMDEGLPMVHRSVNIGGNTVNNILQKNLGINKEDVEQIKQDLSQIPNIDGQIFKSFIDPVVKEIANSFEIYFSLSGNQDRKLEKIILTGGSSILPFLRSELKKNFDTRVFIGDPWARVVHQDGLKMLLDRLGPRMSVAIGLALRNIEK